MCTSGNFHRDLPLSLASICVWSATSCSFISYTITDITINFSHSVTYHHLSCEYLLVVLSIIAACLYNNISKHVLAYFTEVSNIVLLDYV